VTPERPTILQIIPRLDTGGAELATIEIVAAVVAAGGRALVATEGGRMADRIATEGGDLVAMKVATKNPIEMRRNAARLADLVRREGVDLLHARSRAPAWSALWAARRTGRPFVTTYHGAYAEKGPFKRIYNSIMARGDIVIANSRYTADLIQQRYGTPSNRIAVIPRGVDIARFSPASIDPARIAALRRAWHIAPETPVVLHAARLTSWKGQRILIEAFAALAAEQSMDDAVLVLAGDAQGRDAYAKSLKELTISRRISDRVRLVGHVDDIAAAYATAHVTVVASIEPEAFGRAAAEALAAGCPVIATDLGAPPEIVLAAPAVPAGEITGWVVPPTADGLTNGLREALSLPAVRRTAIGARAAADIAARFTLARMKRQTLDVYDRLLGVELSRRLPPE
jgi:glycosyltransferase involved in cell wall biosynthesis